MRTIKDIFADSTITFTPSELVDFEHTIKDLIAEFLPFSSYSLFFPREKPAVVPEPEFRSEDRELILPLVFRDEMLCFFIAKGVRLKAPATAPKYIMALASSVLEKLALYKWAVTDDLTGLHTREFFFAELAEAIDRVQGCLATGNCRAGMEARDAEMTFSGTLGVLFLDLDGFQNINERYGYLSGDDIMAEVGKLLHTVCPKYTTVSRFANDKFAILVPDAKPRACFQLSEVIRSGVSKLSFTDDMTRDTITLTGSLGFANYPQGLEGGQFRRTPGEQARILVTKARRGVKVAKDLGRNRVFNYADILDKGGRVLDTLPMHRVSVTLGEVSGAKVGQRFLVRAARHRHDRAAGTTAPPVYTGEIVLVEVHDDLSVAEVLHLADAGLDVRPGDRLKRIQGEEGLFAGKETIQIPTPDETTKLFPYSEFMARMETARQTPKAFALSLIRVLDQPGDADEGYQEAMDRMIGGVAAIARGAFGENGFGGRYGLNGILYYLEDVDRETLMARTREIERLAADALSIRVSVGSARFPFLDFDRADIPDNCRKALEHALLLPDPKVAVFDSISLNLSADRRFMDGDLYGAIEEFKLALHDDPDNLLARNSLGICYAQLGRFDDARREFETVIASDPKNVLALYNLGWAHHRLGDLDAARKAYRRCLDADPDHLFSLMRLGSIEETAGRFDKATALYQKAAKQPDGERMVLRALARVAYKQDDLETTREYLHLALNADHNDHQAMHLLARIYLDQGEDPQIAEVLSRQCAALCPGKHAYWDTLVEALEAQGKGEEAAKVAARAG